MARRERRCDTALVPKVVLNHAAEAVAGAVAELWPGEIVQVGPQRPSVTNYVTAVQVGQRRMMAKYSLLGTSLVSIIRGVRGPWSSIEPAQRDYIRDPRAQLAMECTQLGLLDALSRCGDNPPQVPEMIAYKAGVLLTAAVEGPSLATELLREQVHAEELLNSVVQTARELHRDPILADSYPAVASDRPHASIRGTFARKFLGPSGEAYRAGLGEGWVEPGLRASISAAFTSVCGVLAPLLTKRPDRAVIYGDLKPEHILLGHAGRQVWLDPGLQHCDPCADFAKLISRTALLLITARPSSNRVAAVTDAIDALVTGLLAPHSSSTGIEDTLRRLLTLWVADWTNYLATGLSLPPDVALPLPPTLLDFADRAEPLLHVARATATAVADSPSRAWEIMLNGINQLVAWPCR